MRLTTRTNLATRVLMFCAVNDGETVRTSEIAARCNASLNHLLQVVNLLQTHGSVETMRGRSGCLRLARPMERISIGEVFRIFEAGVRTIDLFRIWALRMRVSISPKGSVIAIGVAPYQLDLTRPGISPWLPNSRSAMRDIFSLR